MRRLAALVLLAGLMPPAAAAPDPFEAFRELVAKLPAPGPEGAFVLSGEVVVGGEALGTYFLSASVVREGAAAVWQVRSTTQMGSGAGVSRTEEDAVLTAGFTILRGRGESSGPRGRRAWTFDRVKEGLRVEPGSEVLPQEGPALAGMASLFLFCRLAAEDDGTCRAPYLDAGAEGGPALTEAQLTFAGEGDWRGGEAVIVRGRRDAADLTLAFDPKTRAPLGARLRYASPGLELLLLPPGSGRPPLPPDFFERPAQTPEAGAVRAALAILSGDESLAERTFLWTALYSAFRKSDPETDRGYEEYKRAVLDKLAKAPGLRPRGEIETVLRAIYPELRAEAAGEGRARVRFVKPLETLVIEVAATGGEWRLVALPPAR